MSLATLTLSGVILGGRPPTRPLALAALRPASVRSPHQVTLKLGQGTHHGEEQPTIRRGGVDRLGQRPESHLNRPGIGDCSTS